MNASPEDKSRGRAGDPDDEEPMGIAPAGSIAVIFVSGRTAADEAGYAEAAAAMDARAVAMDGYLGIDATRGPDGLGITVSWWRDRAAAAAWRDDPEHVRIRERGRAVWYDWYRLTVAEVERSYAWAHLSSLSPDTGRG